MVDKGKSSIVFKITDKLATRFQLPLPLFGGIVAVSLGVNLRLELSSVGVATHPESKTTTIPLRASAGGFI